MQNLVIATTMVVVVTLASFQPATADFGSLLDKVSIFRHPQQEASAPAAPDVPPAPELNFEDIDPASPNPEAGELAIPDAVPESLDLPLTDSSRQPRLRSPIPPPHVPDESVGLRSEESMIESDAENAIEDDAEYAVESDAEYAVDSDAHQAVESDDPLRLPFSVNFEELSSSPSDISSTHAQLQDSNRSCNHRHSHHHGYACGAATSVGSLPAPYIYAGPGLPPPASLETFSRTPDCYRGLWDGYAEEKQRRCAQSHAHLHGYCDCHRVKAPRCHHVHRGGARVEQPCGTCAKAVAPSSSVVPAVTR